MYDYAYSEEAKKVAECLHEKFPHLDLTIMYFVQLNEFVNHQLAHNVMFVSVEWDLGNFVFDALRELYPGKVLMRAVYSGMRNEEAQKRRYANL